MYETAPLLCHQIQFSFSNLNDISLLPEFGSGSGIRTKWSRSTALQRLKQVLKIILINYIFFKLLKYDFLNDPFFYSILLNMIKSI